MLKGMMWVTILKGDSLSESLPGPRIPGVQVGLAVGVGLRGKVPMRGLRMSSSAFDAPFSVYNLKFFLLSSTIQ